MNALLAVKVLGTRMPRWQDVAMKRCSDNRSLYIEQSKATIGGRVPLVGVPKCRALVPVKQ